MEVQAIAKFVKRTPRKARLVADAVKGMKVGDALAFLEFSPKHAATDVAKVIKSAAANAEHNFNLNREDLVLKQLLIDEGPTMRRGRPVSRGMQHEYFRRTCHITAVVEDRHEVAPPPARRAARPRPAETSRPAPKAATRSTPRPAAAKASKTTADKETDSKETDIKETEELGS